jgi:hypothetical protein
MGYKKAEDGVASKGKTKVEIFPNDGKNDLFGPDSYAFLSISRSIAAFSDCSCAISSSAL